MKTLIFTFFSFALSVFTTAQSLPPFPREELYMPVDSKDRVDSLLARTVFFTWLKQATEGPTQPRQDVLQLCHQSGRIMVARRLVSRV
jgi:hypothetical protein